MEEGEVEEEAVVGEELEAVQGLAQGEGVPC